MFTAAPITTLAAAQAQQYALDEPISILRDGVEIVRADETGVHILERVLLTQAEIRSLIPLARTHRETRMSPHPYRRMTEQELAAWNKEYDELGGMNAEELKVLYRINDIRASRNLHPYILCPALSRASRLHTNLMTDHDFFDHIDPFYFGPPDRSILFKGPTSTVVENSIRGATGSMRAVDSWMNSPGHRIQIVSTRHQYIGIGFTGTFSTTKFSRR